jgi:hypothetical protein
MVIVEKLVVGMFFISRNAGNTRLMGDAKAALMYRRLDNGFPPRSLGFKRGSFYVRFMMDGRAIVQAVSRWFPTAAARIRAQVMWDLWRTKWY